MHLLHGCRQRIKVFRLLQVCSEISWHAQAHAGGNQERHATKQRHQDVHNDAHCGGAGNPLRCGLVIRDQGLGWFLCISVMLELPLK